MRSSRIGIIGVSIRVSSSLGGRGTAARLLAKRTEASTRPPRGQGWAAVNTQVRYRMKFQAMLAIVARPKAVVLMAAGCVTMPGAMGGMPSPDNTANASSPGPGQTLEKNCVRASWMPHEAEIVVIRKRATWPLGRACRAANTQRRLRRKLTVMARPPDRSLAIQTRSSGTEKILVRSMKTTKSVPVLTTPLAAKRRIWVRRGGASGYDRRWAGGTTRKDMASDTVE